MKIVNTFLIVGLLSLATACSNGKSTDSAANVNPIDVSEFTGSNAVASVAMIDSLALEADFLTPEQGVSVLVGLSEIVKNEQAKGASGKKLEYMRKFMDTYEILQGRGEEFASAIANAKASAHIDLPAIASQYSDILNNEADGSAIEGEEDGGTANATPAAPKPKPTEDAEKTAPTEAVPASEATPAPAETAD